MAIFLLKTCVTAFIVIQGHRFMWHLKASMQLSISDQ